MVAFDNISVSLDCYLTSECSLSLALVPQPRLSQPHCPSSTQALVSPTFPGAYSSMSLKPNLP